MRWAGDGTATQTVVQFYHYQRSATGDYALQFVTETQHSDKWGEPQIIKDSHGVCVEGSAVYINRVASLASNEEYVGTQAISGYIQANAPQSATYRDIDTDEVIILSLETVNGMFIKYSNKT